MPCTCPTTNAHQTATPPASHASDKAQRELHSSSHCFYCFCTVCGRDLPDIPTITCGECGSQTHILCARDVYSHEWLFPQVTGTIASTTGTTIAATAGVSAASSCSSGAVKTRVATGKASVALASPTTRNRPTNTIGSPGGSRSFPMSGDASSASIQPSAQAMSSAAAKMNKEYKYYCHPDCAMGMEVMRNPQFNSTLSADIESAFAADWRRTWQMLATHLADRLLQDWDNVYRPSTCSSNVVANEQANVESAETSAQREDGDNVVLEKSSIEATHTCTETSMFERLFLAAKGNAVLAQELFRLYSQLRAEAWADYFEKERHHSGHPLFYPPPFVDVQREAAFNHVLEAAAPHGQAARLYLLDPATYPVGSVVAIPAGVLARWQQPATAPLVKVNDSNNFVAEAAAAVAGGAVVVPQTVTVYKSCHTKGRIVAST